MAAAMDMDGFDVWLSDKLARLEIDQEVFGTYITGILETDDSSYDDKTDALVGILSEIAEESVQETCEEILKKWDESQKLAIIKNEEAKALEKEAKEQAFTALLEKHTSSVTKKEVSAEEKKRKEALLAQYAELSDGEEDEDVEDSVEDCAYLKENNSSIFKNTNKDDIKDAEKAKREKSKMEHEKKKERDKLQREKDKQKVIDRKDKEKKRTQKQERRR
ncbi:coiled-coil domain-containing protein 43-like [Saccoglossus kowalevskii]|uniref:Coiled-coil domain-containing protein 43 n=1 Tax=Saccoglossus kowalevskii TaxID=10224 RepID=A0ABM0MEC1_SACKO|nr:PREDICTED: coiled-coil domain-containing protein 43-like [Saccoglossus kowalevskii]